VAPTTTVDNVSAARLADWIDGDEETVEDLVDLWVPQISAKKVGTKDDGITYTLADIVDHHEDLRDEYGAVLLWSGDYVFRDDKLWITIVPIGYTTSVGALGWCADHDLGNDDCFARLITHDESIENTAAFA